MKAPRLSALTVIALIAYSTTYLLFPRVNSAARWGVVIDRDAAIAKARAVATQLGYDTNCWTPMAVARYHSEIEYDLTNHPTRAISQLLTPTTVPVTFADYHTNRKLRITLNNRGEFTEFRLQEPKAKEPDQKNTSADSTKEPSSVHVSVSQKDSSPVQLTVSQESDSKDPSNSPSKDQSPPQTTASNEPDKRGTSSGDLSKNQSPAQVVTPKESHKGELNDNPGKDQLFTQAASSSGKRETSANQLKDRNLAESTAKLLYGGRLDSLTLSDAGSAKNGHKFTWTSSDPYLKLVIEMTISDSAVTLISLDTNFTTLFRSEYDGRRSSVIKVLSGLDNLVIWPSIVLIVIFYFIGLALKQVMHRNTLIFLGITFLFLLLIIFVGSTFDNIRDDISIDVPGVNYWIRSFIPWLVAGLFALPLALVLYLSWAAGLALAIRTPDRRTIGLELLFKGKIVTKPVLKSILAGLLFGGPLSAIAYLIIASGIFKRAEMRPANFEDIFVAHFPALSSFAAFRQILIFITVAFLGSLVNLFVKRRLIARVLNFVIIFLGVLGTNVIFVSAPALSLVALIEALLLIGIYYRFDVLAVMTAVMAANAAVNSAALLAQPLPSLQSSGRNIIYGMITLTVASMVGFLKAREVRDDEVAVPPGLLSTRSERERLRAEFDVARRAQQQMLPDAPPQIPGIEIAAVCQPSKDVGGDLYDFLLLPEGKLGIVVADVSGKGVPASLYMTLTKGLLDSVSEEKTDPGEILREVNRHLYEVCRRKVFVTLFLGVIDPARKTFEYARAGHNPTVFLNASEQSAMLLKSPGIGLGLNNGKIFDQSLKVASLQLNSRDVLLFYSDGITEAMNGKNEEYGEERLMAIAAKIDGMNAEQARDLIMSDVQKFLGATHPQDDQTLVVVRIL